MLVSLNLYFILLSLYCERLSSALHMDSLTCLKVHKNTVLQHSVILFLNKFWTQNFLCATFDSKATKLILIFPMNTRFVFYARLGKTIQHEKYQTYVLIWKSSYTDGNPLALFFEKNVWYSTLILSWGKNVKDTLLYLLPKIDTYIFSILKRVTLVGSVRTIIIIPDWISIKVNTLPVPAV